MNSNDAMQEFKYQIEEIKQELQRSRVTMSDVLVKYKSLIEKMRDKWGGFHDEFEWKIDLIEHGFSKTHSATEGVIKDYESLIKDTTKWLLEAMNGNDTIKQKFWDEELSADKSVKLYPHSYGVFGSGAIFDIVWDEVEKVFPPVILVMRNFVMLPPHATRDQIESIRIGVEKRVNELQPRDEIKESINMLRSHLEKLEVVIGDALAELRYIGMEARQPEGKGLQDAAESSPVAEELQTRELLRGFVSAMIEANNTKP